VNVDRLTVSCPVSPGDQVSADQQCDLRGLPGALLPKGHDPGRLFTLSKLNRRDRNVSHCQDKTFHYEFNNFCGFLERQKRNGQRKSLTCEGRTAKLRCGKTLLVLLCPQHFTPLVSPVVVISVVKANYGRLDKRRCSRGRSRAQLTCLLPPVFTPHISIHRCNGKRRCNLKASNSVFGDPCRGTYKYLEVDFVCKSE
uniref:SUEL-type lectin domain-containing protein n=1 Tax=Salarias fasciatus TaxID=181472 RepID=A0A672HBA1_SALFA